MNEHRSKLYLVLGAWVSFIAIMMSVSIVLPPSKSLSNHSTALLYKLASNDVIAPLNTPVSSARIAVDLDVMTISLFNGEDLVKTFPVLSKGREGTFWETPTGNYEVGTKEIKHFSSIGGTWMPYSMQFYGNFFIHGWPTYPNGKDVPKGYSGGCIRLNTDDAREVYEFASVGTKVSVVGSISPHQLASSSQYYLREPTLTGLEPKKSPLPDIFAPIFLVADVESGDVLWQKSAGAYVRMNDLIALPIALTALETVDQYKYVRMGDLLLDRSVLRKKPTGKADELSVGSLIYPLLFDTNDTAAQAFAREIGVKSFIRDMNKKIQAIGMEDSQFAGVIASGESTTTARDLFSFLKYVNEHKHFLIDVTLSKERTFVGSDGETQFHWENKNPWLLSGVSLYRGGIGTVRTDGSGNAMLLFALPVSEFSERTIAFIVPESSNIVEDVEQLKTFVLDRFVFGIERDSAMFIREKGEPAPSLIQQMLRVIHLNDFLQERVEYQREV